MSSFDQPLAPVRAMTASFVDEISAADSSTTPQPARIYDYLLNGGTNLGVDRDFAKKQIDRHPDLPLIAEENRSWLIRATRFIRAAGVRQFLDLGSGFPDENVSIHNISDSGAGNVEESRVIYVDNDPIVAIKIFNTLSDVDLIGRHNVIRGDIRQADRIWQVAVDEGMFDPARPVGLIAAALLHFVPDEVGDGLMAPERAMAFLRERCAPGSYLALSHGTLDDANDTDRAQITEIADDYTARSTAPVHLRGRDEITRLFGDWPMVNPGLAWTPQWRPGDWKRDLDEPAKARILAGVAHHPVPADNRSAMGQIA